MAGEIAVGVRPIADGKLLDVAGNRIDPRRVVGLTIDRPDPSVHVEVDTHRRQARWEVVELQVASVIGAEPGDHADKSRIVRLELLARMGDPDPPFGVGHDPSRDAAVGNVEIRPIAALGIESEGAVAAVPRRPDPSVHVHRDPVGAHTPRRRFHLVARAHFAGAEVDGDDGRWIVGEGIALPAGVGHPDEPLELRRQRAVGVEGHADRAHRLTRVAVELDHAPLAVQAHPSVAAR